MDSQSPPLHADYAPPSQTILATSIPGSIPESDLMLFLAITKDKEPNIFARFMQERDPQQKEELKEKVKKAVQSYMFTWELSRMAPPSSEPENVATLRLRLKSYPAYEFIWVEEVLRPIVRITDKDIQAYYNDNKTKYQRPESVKLRLLFLPAPLSLPEIERQKIRIRIEELYKKAQQRGEFESIVRENSSPFPGVGPDGIMVIDRGKTYNRFYDEARLLKEGTFSPVFQREEGFFFLQCLEKKEMEEIPLEEVQADIRRQLEATSLRYLYTLEWEKLEKKYQPTLIWIPWEEMKDNSTLIHVGNFKMTKDEFWHLFPAVVGENFTIDKSLIQSQADIIRQYECIRKDVERKKLDSHPYIKLGTIIAAEQIAAERYLEQKTIPLKTVTADDLKLYYKKRPDLSTLKAWREAIHLVGEINQPDQYPPDAIGGVREKLKTTFGSLLAEAKGIIADEQKKREEQKRDAIGLSSSLFANLLKKYSDDKFLFRIYDLKRQMPETDPELWTTLKSLSPGEFSNPVTHLNLIYCYYVGKRFDGERLPFEKVKNTLESKLIEERIKESRQALRESILKQSALAFEPILK
ncbi:MAG: peptidyl-prolyl cis-trans isomerase [Candidatus Sumerlaeota bacterium]|nr:peptidyl-prolyl cis-trans isomerase [Candidatus Sumerlaeota bacterium]